MLYVYLLLYIFVNIHVYKCHEPCGSYASANFKNNDDPMYKLYLAHSLSEKCIKNASWYTIKLAIVYNSNCSDVIATKFEVDLTLILFRKNVYPLMSISRIHQMILCKISLATLNEEVLRDNFYQIRIATKQ